MQLYESDDPTLTVRELIEQLQKFPPDFLVYTEGCDCIGTTACVDPQDDDAVLITRKANDDGDD